LCFPTLENQGKGKLQRQKPLQEGRIMDHQQLSSRFYPFFPWAHPIPSGADDPCGAASRHRFQPPAAWRVALLLLAALLLAGCAHIYTIGPADSGKTIQLQQGDSLVLQLSANPTTGYHWVIEQNDSTRLPLQSSDYSADNPGTIGGGGTTSFTFKAMQPGTVSLALQYQGPQTQNPPIANTFTLTVQIA
jgi:predicted secreted protein